MSQFPNNWSYLAFLTRSPKAAAVSFSPFGSICPSGLLAKFHELVLAFGTQER
jgi:hypothetical protein